jgi:hypothetical protein
MAILNHELHSQVLGVHVGHFALEAVVAHDGGREHDGQVLGGHEVLALAAGDAEEMEHEELERVAVLGREHVDGLAHVGAALLFVLDSFKRDVSKVFLG